MFFAPLPNYGKIVALTSASRKMRLLASCFHLAAVFPQKGIPDMDLSKFATIVPLSTNPRKNEPSAWNWRKWQYLVSQQRREAGCLQEKAAAAAATT